MASRHTERDERAPNTSTKGPSRRWPLYALAIVALAALSLCAEAFLRTETFSPGKEITSRSIRAIAASTEDGLYPPPDTNRFEEPPETILVYLSVEGLPSRKEMEARIQKYRLGLSILPLFRAGGRA